jgi:hypothetical protein
MQYLKPTRWLVATPHNQYPLAVLAKGLTEVVKGAPKYLVLFSPAGRDRPP